MLYDSNIWWYGKGKPIKAVKKQSSGCHTFMEMGENLNR